MSSQTGPLRTPLVRRAWAVIGPSDAWITLLLMVVLGSIITPLFYSPVNIENLLRQSTIIGVMTIGQFLVLFSGGFDLSVGSVLALSTIIIARYAGHGNFLGIAVALLACGGLGLVNGISVTWGRLPPFIATLGMMGIARGLSFAVSNNSIVMVDQTLSNLDKVTFGPVPLPTILWLVGICVVYFFLRISRLGVHIQAVGGREPTARLAGINITRAKVFVYTVSGLLAGVGGVLFVARSGTGMPHVGQGWELDTITCAVIGGTNLFGGEGSLTKAMAGVLIYMMIRNLMNLVGLDPFVQDMMKGVVILAAVSLRAAQAGKE